MKIVIAQMKHETNTFSPVPTRLERFSGGREQPLEGQSAIDALAGTGSASAALLDLALKAGAQVDFAIAANAPPSGPVENDAFDYMTARICDAVRKGCDAILLDLHGAMVTRSYDDGEGELLRRIRVLAPKVPIGVALDMHTNLFPAMVDQATVIAGYQTYPHIDMYETGLRAAGPVLALLQKRARPVMAWGNRPMLPHVMRQGSDDSPNLELQARCRQMEEQGALSATVFVGFPHADITHAGLSAVVVTDANPALARQYCDELLEMAWRQRQAFVYTVEPLAVSFARAEELASAAGVGPVVLLDHYDNCASGGTMDTMTVLGAILDAGLSNVAAFAIYDPEAAKRLAAAGLGSTVTLPLGGNLPMPSIGQIATPRVVTGKVKKIVDGHYRNEGPMGRGEQVNMGLSVVLDTGKVEIAVISRHVEPHDIASLRVLGIEPEKKRFLMLKSRIHWRAGLRRYAKAIVECAGVGVCTSDYSTLDFKRVRRPIFPLDAI
jgi:microcystin degradation protein MlrC